MFAFADSRILPEKEGMPRILLPILLSVCAVASAAENAPAEWIEPETGHRVIRLSQEPGTTKLYFHQNAFTATGDKMLVLTPKGISTVAFAKREIELVVEGRATQIVVGPKSRRVFYTRDNTVFATQLDRAAQGTSPQQAAGDRGYATREIAKLPPDWRRGSGLALNADETLLAGSVEERSGPAPAAAVPPPQSQPQPQLPADVWKPGQRRSLEERWAMRLPMRLFTIGVETGETKSFHPSTDWLNHVQFSPSDPGLLMFCHEGPWHKVDRIWTIRADGSELRKIHTRAMEMEIAGHEFFSPDGKTIWYDLQTPKGAEFWLAGYEIATGQLTKYRVAREHWSVHYNVSPDGKLFAGDGGGPHSVAAPGNGQWIYLFTPKDGALEAERLVDLSRHDYQLEPNVDFTPDGKWIVFQATIHGAPQVYAVEVAKAR
jgi:oligogalacturonide lyase